MSLTIILIGRNTAINRSIEYYVRFEDEDIHFIIIKYYNDDGVKIYMLFFKKKTAIRPYDKENKKPAVRVSICTGEMVAGFQNHITGNFEEVMLVKNDKDIEEFKKIYGIEGKLEKIY